MQDLKSCFFTNEVVVRDSEGEKVELKGNVHFMKSKIDNLTICHLVVVNEKEDYDVNSLGRDLTYNPNSLESQRMSFYDALERIVDSTDFTLSFIERDNINIEEV